MLKWLFIALIISPALSHAQTNELPDEKEINFDRFWFNTFQLSGAVRSAAPAIKVSGIRIIDARFDTSTIGFMQKRLS